MAADAGNAHAMMTLGQRLLGRNDPNARKYLEMAWLAGDVNAASHLSYLYSKGSAQDADLVTANAYMYLHYKILDEMVAGGGELRGPPVSPEYVRNTAFRISANEMEQSHQIAKDILRSNANCCFSRRVIL